MPNKAASSEVSHFLTFDLEHWYLGYRYRGAGGWEKFPARDHLIVERLLNLLGEFKHKATFFVTGVFVAEFPSLMKEINDAGHEVASHSFNHTLVCDFPNLSAFQEDLRRSLGTIEDALGEKVIGFRAPKWSIPKNPELFYKALIDEGLQYDSSLFPSLGASGVPDSPFLRELGAGKKIWEFPATTIRVANLRIPAAGGLWLRLFPAFLSHLALRQGAAEGNSKMVYLHPYDLDPGCPRLFSSLSLGAIPFMFARYYRLDQTERVLRGLFTEFCFTSISEWLHTKGMATQVSVRPT